MAVFVQKNQIQVAAVAQFQAAQLAIGNDGEVFRQVLRHDVAHAQGMDFGKHALPAPACGDVQNGVRQCAEIVCHLFHR